MAKKQESSSGESDSDSDADKKPAGKTPAKLTAPLKTSTPNNFKPMKFVSGGFVQPTVQKPAKESSSEEDSDSDEEEETKPAQNNVTANGGKKRKLSTSEESETPNAKKSNKNNSLNKSSNSKPNTPFRRVKNEDVEVDNRLADNSFDAKVRVLQQKYCVQLEN